jgi:hypothetical protein
MFNLWSINGGMGYMRRYAGVGGGTQACTPETLFNLFRKIHFQLFFEKLRHE